MWQSLCWVLADMVNKVGMVPVPAVLYKITTHKSMSPSLLVVRGKSSSFLCSQHLAEDLSPTAKHMGFPQKWLQNKLRVSWAEGKNMCSMMTCIGTMSQWLEPRLSKEKWDETLMKKGKARSLGRETLTSSSRQWGDSSSFKQEVLYSYFHFKKHVLETVKKTGRKCN